MVCLNILLGWLDLWKWDVSFSGFKEKRRICHKLLFPFSSLNSNSLSTPAFWLLFQQVPRSLPTGVKKNITTHPTPPPFLPWHHSLSYIIILNLKYFRGARTSISGQDNLRFLEMNLTSILSRNVIGLRSCRLAKSNP